MGFNFGAFAGGATTGFMRERDDQRRQDQDDREQQQFADQQAAQQAIKGLPAAGSQVRAGGSDMSQQDAGPPPPTTATYTPAMRNQDINDILTSHGQYQQAGQYADSQARSGYYGAETAAKQQQTAQTQSTIDFGHKLAQDNATFYQQVKSGDTDGAMQNFMASAQANGLGQHVQMGKDGRVTIDGTTFDPKSPNDLLAMHGMLSGVLLQNHLDQVNPTQGAQVRQNNAAANLHTAQATTVPYQNNYYDAQSKHLGAATSLAGAQTNEVQSRTQGLNLANASTETVNGLKKQLADETDPDKIAALQEKLATMQNAPRVYASNVRSSDVSNTNASRERIADKNGTSRVNAAQVRAGAKGSDAAKIKPDAFGNYSDDKTGEQWTFDPKTREKVMLNPGKVPDDLVKAGFKTVTGNIKGVRASRIEGPDGALYATVSDAMEANKRGTQKPAGALPNMAQQ